MKFTERDAHMIRWMNGHGFVTIRQIARWMGSSYRAARRRAQRLTGSETQTFDWAALDLEQWIATLGTAQRFPDSDKLTPDGLTGTGNFLDLANTDEARPDVVSRTQQRLEGIDPATVRRRGRDEFSAGHRSKR